MLAPQCGMATPSLGPATGPFPDAHLPQWDLEPDSCLAASSPMVLRALCLAQLSPPAHRGAQSAKGT